MPLMSRRDFTAGLASSIGGVALMAHGAWPDGTRSLSLRQIEIDVGAETPFEAIHVSDTHLCLFSPLETVAVAKGEYLRRRAKGFPDSSAYFAATLAEARRTNALLLHTGDLIDFISDANLECLRRNADRFIFARGNHDYWNPADPNGKNWRSDQTKVQAIFKDDLYLASRVVRGVNFVSIDNADARISKRVFSGLKREFDKGLPVVLMMHVPFYTEDLFEFSYFKMGRSKKGSTASLTAVPDEVIDANYPIEKREGARVSKITQEAIDFLRSRKELKAILCGHLHGSFATRFSGSAMQYVAGANARGEGYAIRFR